MAVQTSKRETHLSTERPPFERVALILQGGGALGACQAGVYQALAEANLHPDWVAGISIGAVNAAPIGGNPPESAFSNCARFGKPSVNRRSGSRLSPASTSTASSMHTAVNQTRSLGILLAGADVVGIAWDQWLQGDDRCRKDSRV